MGFSVVTCSCNESDIHPIDLRNFVHINFREDDLFCDTHGIVAAAVKSFIIHTTEISYAGKSNGDQPVEEFVHLVTAEGNTYTDGVSFSQFEV